MGHSSYLCVQNRSMGFPLAFEERLRRQRGDAEDLLESIRGVASLSVRLNPGKVVGLEDLVDGAEVVPWCGEGRYLRERPNFTLMPQLHGGAFYVQEPSSMSLGAALDVALPLIGGEPVCLDLCAAPGGKATLLMSRVGKGGVVVANEVVRQRAWILRENVAKWGSASAIVTNRTAGQIGESGVMFDLITVDAPCSGEGMFRKDAGAVSEWSEQGAAQCAVRQREILGAIWPALRAGGLMVYSTSTYNPEENERNIDWLHDTYGARALELELPAEVERIDTRAGVAYGFYPHKVRGEGFFLCLLRKGDDDGVVAVRRGKRQVGQYRQYRGALGCVEGLSVYQRGEELYGFPVGLSQRMVGLAEALDPLMAGVHVGTVMEKRGKVAVCPGAELPLSMAYVRGSMAEVEVSLEVARKYLHGDADIAVGEGVADGWVVVTYGGLPLGFVKKMGGRVNNYYPKEWRIKMDIQKTI